MTYLATTEDAIEPSNLTDLPHSRIVEQARRRLFAAGYSAFTMDELARELGMSKKTLYVYFSGKQAIVAAVIDAFGAEIREEAEMILRNRELNFVEKLRGYLNGMVERTSSVGDSLLKDLKRAAPALYRRIEDNRTKNIPYIFGRFIEQGQISGMVRDDINPAFAVEYYLHAVQGLFQPETMKRLNLAHSDICPRALDLFFSGLFTPKGRKEYEKLFPR